MSDFETHMKSGKPIGLCCDHAGLHIKNAIMQYLNEVNIPNVDFGTTSSESCDYPDFAHPCATAIEKGDCIIGIAVCSTGNGIAMTLNKHKGVRAALCWSSEIARLAREHNNANVLVLPGSFMACDTALEILEIFLATKFQGGRHQRRIDKIPIITS